jgi:NitT/TauT family transport system permease protein
VSGSTAPRERAVVGIWQVAIVIAVLALWELGTRIPWFVQHTFLDPFFVSRPSLIAQRLWFWATASGKQSLWPHVVATLWATFLGFLVGVGTGFAAGLYLGGSRRAAAVMRPFIVAINSLPRIALVPLITMFFGLGLLSKVVMAWFIVFFAVFFNTFKGALSIEADVLNFCRTLGGSERQITWAVRVPNALAWTFASLPMAVSFSLIGVVIAEFVGSSTGLGYIMIVSLSTLNATDMFVALVVLGGVGVLLVVLIERVERRLLHWTPEFQNRL